LDFPQGNGASGDWINIARGPKQIPFSGIQNFPLIVVKVAAGLDDISV
jgi:hypothetical protein